MNRDYEILTPCLGLKVGMGVKGQGSGGRRAGEPWTSFLTTSPKLSLYLVTCQQQNPALLSP